MKNQHRSKLGKLHRNTVIKVLILLTLFTLPQLISVHSAQAATSSTNVAFIGGPYRHQRWHFRHDRRSVQPLYLYQPGACQRHCR